MACATWTLGQLNEAPATLKARDIQAITGLSWPSTLRLIHSSGFPAVYCGRSILIPTSAFIKYWEQAGR